MQVLGDKLDGRLEGRRVGGVLKGVEDLGRHGWGEIELARGRGSEVVGDDACHLRAKRLDVNWRRDVS